METKTTLTLMYSRNKMHPPFAFYTRRQLQWQSRVNCNAARNDVLLCSVIVPLIPSQKRSVRKVRHDSEKTSVQWLKWFCEAVGGGHLTKPRWSKPHTHSNTTNLALFTHNIALHRFNQGGSYYCRGLRWEQGVDPPHPGPTLTLTTAWVMGLPGRQRSLAIVSPVWI